MTGPFREEVSDKPGYTTLRNFSKATAFNQWLYDTIAPFCGEAILEIGSGIGNISSLLLQSGAEISASDIREEYVHILQQKFQHFKNFKGAYLLDVSKEDFDALYGEHAEKYDTVIALNVIEHIENDQLAIRNCVKLLKKNGKLIILLPAFHSLYNSTDQSLGHFKRYTKKNLENMLKAEHLHLQHTSYFNAAGIAGWWANGALFRGNTIPAKPLSIFNKLIPVVKLLDFFLRRYLGLSTWAVAIK